MLSVTRHGQVLHFDDGGLSSLPYVYRPLERGTVYEEDFLEHIRSLGRRGAYLDIGAHVGTHTVWFATLCSATHVHAFEPMHRFGDLVERNIAANGLADRVTLHRVGLDEHPGHATNVLSPEHQWGFDTEPETVTVDFPVTTVDDVVSEPVAVMKLDVEGMEAMVLRGARRVLSRWRPAVFAEAHSEEAAAELGAFLGEFGYRRTGRVFNSSPTYEYVAPPRRGVEHLRPLWTRVPVSVRRPLGRRLRRLLGR